MSTGTTNAGYGKAVDGDNAKTYLETTLGSALDKLDVHAHGTDATGLAVTRVASGTTFATPTLTGTVTVSAATIGPLVNGALPILSNAISGDVTLVNSATWYDGPSISLTAGTWLMTGHILVKNSGGGAMTARLWDGTTTYSSSECLFELSSVTDYQTLPVSWILTTASTPTLKISAASTTGSSTSLIKAACADNAVGNTASVLVAVRIA